MDCELVMFWKKQPAVPVPNEDSNLQVLAQRLGVERRRSARVLYPRDATSPLPAISVLAGSFQVHDISMGGCCLLDPAEILGNEIGQELDLQLSLGGSQVSVRCRLVGRVYDRRHIQFLNAPPDFLARMSAIMKSGIRGQSVRRTLAADGRGPSLAAKEIWNSLAGDALVLTDDIHLQAQVVIESESFEIYRDAWPMTTKNRPVTREELFTLLLFIANIPQPSPSVSKTLRSLEEIYEASHS